MILPNPSIHRLYGIELKCFLFAFVCFIHLQYVDSIDAENYSMCALMCLHDVDLLPMLRFVYLLTSRLEARRQLPESLEKMKKLTFVFFFKKASRECLLEYKRPWQRAIRSKKVFRSHSTTQHNTTYAFDITDLQIRPNFFIQANLS